MRVHLLDLFAALVGVEPQPGSDHRIGARIAARVAVTVPGTPLHRGEHVGMPLRTAISSLDRPARRAEARAAFGLDPDRPTLLVFGGWYLLSARKYRAAGGKTE